MIADEIGSGAAGSPGSTSLTGKAEQADYESFIGFLITYCQDLMSIPPHDSQEGDDEKNEQALTGELDLILAGYSYGSLVLARLQPTSAIATHFQGFAKDSIEAEIVGRAKTVSTNTKRQVESPPDSSATEGPHQSTSIHGQRASASSVTLGDDHPRRQKKMHIGHFRKSTGSQHQETRLQSDHTIGSTPEPLPSKEGNSAPHISTRYLLISPVILPFTHSLCPPGSPSIMLSMGRATAASSPRSSYLDHPTLTVFGDSDGFTSSQRLRTWAEKQSRESRCSFEWAEIDEAGHFWREDGGAMQALQQKVVSWSRLQS